MSRSCAFWNRLCLLAGIIALATIAGCQSMHLPWSSTAGLPPQWEPATETASQ